MVVVCAAVTGVGTTGIKKIAAVVAVVVVVVGEVVGTAVTGGGNTGALAVVVFVVVCLTSEVEETAFIVDFSVAVVLVDAAALASVTFSLSHSIDKTVATDFIFAPPVEPACPPNAANADNKVTASRVMIAVLFMSSPFPYNIDGLRVALAHGVDIELLRAGCLCLVEFHPDCLLDRA